MDDYKYHLDFKEERLKELFIKIADEAIGKIQYCRTLVADHNILPLMSSDVGATEVNNLVSILLTISNIREIKNQVLQDNLHEASRKKKAKKPTKQSKSS